ncbi:MAG: hypothetical protein ACTHL6_08430 [Arthrobacter sp.]
MSRRRLVRREAALRVMDFLRPGYLVMDRAMLLGIRKRAEGNAHSREPSPAS